MMTPDLLTQVRLYADQIDEQTKSIDELLDDLLATPAPQPTRAPRRGWLVAVAAAVAVFVLAGLTLLLLDLLEEEPVVEEPKPPPVESLAGLVIEDVPSFVAVVEYRLDDREEPSGVIEISYRRVDDGLRMEYLVESVAWLDKDFDPPVDGWTYQPGDFLVWDNSQVAFDNEIEGRHIYQTDASFTGLGQLGWVTGWSDACAPDSINILASEAIAGLPALHLRCATIDGEVELWIDEQTGVVLAVSGVVTIGPSSAPEGVITEPSGGYTITSIEYLTEPAFDSSIFEVADDFAPDSFEVFERDLGPGIHIVVRRLLAAELIAGETDSDITEDSVRTVETWYLDESTWRENVVDSQGTPWAGPWTPGSYTVVSDGQRLTYVSDGHAYVLEEDQESLPPAIDMHPTRQSILDSPDCSYVGDTTYLDRPVQEYECGSANLDPLEQTAAQRRGVSETYQYLIDSETGVVLYEAGPAETTEVLSIDFDVTNDPALFSTTPPPGSTSMWTEPRPHPLVGQPAPTLEGTLLDGNTFNPTIIEGNRSALYFWASWCDDCLEALNAIQTQSEQAGNEIAFVTVLTFDDPEAGQNAIDFHGVTLPVINDIDGSLFDNWQVYDWPWLILINADGIIIEVWGGGLTDHIATNLNQILDTAPWQSP